MRVLGSVVPVQNFIVCCARAWEVCTGLFSLPCRTTGHHQLYFTSSPPSYSRASPIPHHGASRLILRIYRRPRRCRPFGGVNSISNDIQNSVHPSRILGQIGSNIAGHTVPPRCIAPWPAIRRNETSVRWAPLASSGLTPHAALAASTPRPPPRLLPPSAATTPTMATPSSRARLLVRPGRLLSSPTRPWRLRRLRYHPSTTTARTASRVPCVWYDIPRRKWVRSHADCEVGLARRLVRPLPLR